MDSALLACGGTLQLVAPWCEKICFAKRLSSMWVGAACCLASGELFTANFETDSLLPGLSPPTQLDSQLGEFAKTILFILLSTSNWPPSILWG